LSRWRVCGKKRGEFINDEARHVIAVHHVLATAVLAAAVDALPMTVRQGLVSNDEPTRIEAEDVAVRVLVTALREVNTTNLD